MVDSNLNILIQRDLFHMAANNENSPNCEESCCEHEEQSSQASGCGGEGIWRKEDQNLDQEILEISINLLWAY